MSNLSNPDFVRSLLMGPNCLTLLEEMLPHLDLPAAKRILDLGCGNGLTSMYLAERSAASIFAMDLWISATENDHRFRQAQLDRQIIPIHADAHHPPFADGYFDMMISVDAYHYFGRDERYMDDVLSRLVTQNGLIALALPGLKQELDGELPPEMAVTWTLDDLDTWHSCAWWSKLLSSSKTVDIISIREMNGFDECWDDWLASDNPYAQADRRALEAGAGKYMNFIFILLKRL